MTTLPGPELPNPTPPPEEIKIIRQWKMILAFFKAREEESGERSLAILGTLEPPAIKLFLAWPNLDHPQLPIENRPDPPIEPNEVVIDPMYLSYPPVRMWDWIWACTKINVIAWRTLAGFKISPHGDDFQRYVKILRGNRLIYPDGSILRAAEKFIKQITTGRWGI